MLAAGGTQANSEPTQPHHSTHATTLARTRPTLRRLPGYTDSREASRWATRKLLFAQAARLASCNANATTLLGEERDSDAGTGNADNGDAELDLDAERDASRCRERDTTQTDANATVDNTQGPCGTRPWNNTRRATPGLKVRNATITLFNSFLTGRSCCVPVAHE